MAAVNARDFIFLDLVHSAGADGALGIADAAPPAGDLEDAIAFFGGIASAFSFTARAVWFVFPWFVG